jgi:hypothetical protein
MEIPKAKLAMCRLERIEEARLHFDEIVEERRARRDYCVKGASCSRESVRRGGKEKVGILDYYEYLV